MDISQRFKEHNATSAVVEASWCNEDKQVATRGPETWAFNRIELEDGTVYFLPAADVAAMVAEGFFPRWAS